MTPLARKMLYVGYPVLIVLNIAVAWTVQSDGWHRVQEAYRFAPVMLAAAGLGILYLALTRRR